MSNSAPTSPPAAADTPEATLGRAGEPLRLGVLCLSASLGGLELNSLKFALWMQQRGHHVTFIIPPGTPLAERAREWQVPLSQQPVRRGLGLPAAARQLRRTLEQGRIDVLVVTENKDLNLVALVKLGLGSRLRVLYQQHMRLGGAKRDLFHTLRFRILDAWLSPLPGLVRQVQEKTRIAPSRIHLVPLGLPLAQFAPAPGRQAEYRRALSLPEPGPLLGILGRLDDGKGQEFVIRVLAHLRRTSGLDAHLLIMGELTRNEGDAYLQHLRRLVQELGLEAQVHFREFRDDPAIFYRAIDVFVMASVNETYGMVTLEAQAAQVPLVGAATGGTVELVQDEQTGLLFPLLDIEAAARQVQRCLLESDTTRRRVQQAYQHVQGYSHHRQCRLTEEIVQHLPPAGK